MTIHSLDKFASLLNTLVQLPSNVLARLKEHQEHA